jgi:hypothetical protein
MAITFQFTLQFRHNDHSNFAVLDKGENDLTIQLSLAMLSNYLIEKAFIQKNPTRCNSVSTFIITNLYEAQHVSGDTPPVIRSQKLH